MKMVGGTGIIGQDMVCGFGKGFVPMWEYGDINAETGENSVQINSRYRTVNFFKCKPNTKYEIIPSTEAWIGIFMYSKNGYIKKTTGAPNVKKYFTTGAEIVKIRFTFVSNFPPESFKVKEVS